MLEDQATGPVNPYGRAKLRAEEIHREWQTEGPNNRALVIVRPSVVFGENNRGNVYELLRHIIARKFVMVGSGRNKKSMAYVGNLSAFLVYVLNLGVGSHLFNYADKPDLSVRELVETILQEIGRRPVIRMRVPYIVGCAYGVVCDIAGWISGRRLPISATRVSKFCANSIVSAHRVETIGFRAPTSLREALKRTIKHEMDQRDRDLGRRATAI